MFEGMKKSKMRGFCVLEKLERRLVGSFVARDMFGGVEHRKLKERPNFRDETLVEIDSVA